MNVDLKTNRGLGFFMCPNKHIYSIGECKQAMEISICRGCGAQIGGHNHTLLSDYAQVGQIVDTTKQGYVNTGKDVEGVRTMAAFELSILQMLINIGLLSAREYLNSDIAKVCGLGAQDLQEWLKYQINRILAEAGKLLGKSLVDIIILIAHVASSRHIWQVNVARLNTKPGTVALELVKALRMYMTRFD